MRRRIFGGDGREVPSAPPRAYSNRPTHTEPDRADPSDRAQLSTADLLARASMKNAASCDTWCELQNSVNHRIFERKWRSRVVPGARPSEGRFPRPSRPRRTGARSWGVAAGPRPPKRTGRSAGGPRDRARPQDAWASLCPSRGVAAPRRPDPTTPPHRLATSDRARPPAELKHITKRRKRN